jgi:hypothetical protein
VTKSTWDWDEQVALLHGPYNTYRNGRWCTRLDTASWTGDDMLQGWLNDGFPTGTTWRLTGTEMALATKLNIPFHEYAKMKRSDQETRARRGLGL